MASRSRSWRRSLRSSRGPTSSVIDTSIRYGKAAAGPLCARSPEPMLRDITTMKPTRRMSTTVRTPPPRNSATVFFQAIATAGGPTGDSGSQWRGGLAALRGHRVATSGGLHRRDPRRALDGRGDGNVGELDIHRKNPPDMHSDDGQDDQEGAEPGRDGWSQDRRNQQPERGEHRGDRRGSDCAAQYLEACTQAAVAQLPERRRQPDHQGHHGQRGESPGRKAGDAPCAMCRPDKDERGAQCMEAHDGEERPGGGEADRSRDEDAEPPQHHRPDGRIQQQHELGADHAVAEQLVP